MKLRKSVKTKFICLFSIPLAIIYIAFLFATKTSFKNAAIGYIFLAISFGVFQSLFIVEKPYRSAFLSTALAPLLAYSIISLYSIYINPLLSSPEPLAVLDFSGDVIPITPTPYISKYGSSGMQIFYIVIVILIIPFGLMGISGRFLGQEIRNLFIRMIDQRALNDEIKNDSEEEKYIVSAKDKADRVSAQLTIAAAVISGAISIVVAFL